ncbi:MAG: NADH-quinone oxidoreductase subunit, partial [Conexibacter sp.]|nr:NADH-quinone oxidoreductase subunit [Conexibacter sp.]
MNHLAPMLAASVATPKIDWAGVSPIIALLGGSVIVLMAGLLRGRLIREQLVPLLTLVAFGTTIGLGVWQWDEAKDLFVAKGAHGAMRLDDLTLMITFIVCVTGIAAVLLSWRALAPREAAHGEYYALMLTSAAGMVILAAATNLVTLFLGLELLSIPLYILCATEMRRERSLESGLKYLIIG